VLRRNVKTGEVANACPLCDVEARGGSEEDRKLVADKIKSGDSPGKTMNNPQVPHDNSSNESQAQTHAISPPPSDPVKPDNTEQKPSPWWKRWKPWERIIAIFGVAAALGLAGLTYLQWRDLRANFAIDERAWIKETDELRHTSEIPRTSVPIKISNVGKSAANKVFVTAALALVERDKAPLFANKHGFTRSRVSLMFPNSEDSIPIPFSESDGTELRLTDTQVQELNEGKYYISVYGQITYEDQFGSHWTRFCDWTSYSKDPQIQFTAFTCISDWNAVGDGNPPAQETNKH
jgi:hypothetical protein